jgi:hypothetical protein
MSCFPNVSWEVQYHFHRTGVFDDPKRTAPRVQTFTGVDEKTRSEEDRKRKRQENKERKKEEYGKKKTNYSSHYFRIADITSMED